MFFPVYLYLAMVFLCCLNVCGIIYRQKKTKNAIPSIDRYEKEKNKKVIGFIKDELSGKITTKFVGIRVKIDSYLTET